MSQDPQMQNAINIAEKIKYETLNTDKPKGWWLNSEQIGKSHDLFYLLQPEIDCIVAELEASGFKVRLDMERCKLVVIDYKSSNPQDV